MSTTRFNLTADECHHLAIAVMERIMRCADLPASDQNREHLRVLRDLLERLHR